jgi:Na+-transporting methylmalonyl-CoA/oxaloacetate decarboxylase gamma subunit
VFCAVATPKNLKNINISLGQTFEITLFAMSVVFCVLIFLMFVIIVQTKVLGGGKNKNTETILNNKEDSKEVVEEIYENDEEIVAAIIGALSVELNVPQNKINIKSIKRVNNSSSWRNSAIDRI